MLGLGLKRKGIHSRHPVIDTLGNFSIETELDADVLFFRITSKDIEHANDATDNDNNPKVVISNLVVKVNGTVSSEYNLTSSSTTASNNYSYVTHISSSSMSFEDTTFGSFHSTLIIYNDTTTNFSAQSGDTITVTGNIKLGDGTAYAPETGYEDGRIEFTFNNHTNNAGNKLQVFINPSYNSGAVGTTDKFTTVNS